MSAVKCLDLFFERPIYSEGSCHGDAIRAHRKAPRFCPGAAKSEDQMWKRDEAVKPAGPGTPATPAAPAQHQAEASAPAQPDSRRQQMMERDVVNIGKSVVIKGELNGSEDLTVEGHVEGKIELRDHVLTIGPNGKIKAQVFAKAVIVLGEVNGNVTATEKVDILDCGSVDGDIVSPRVAIAEGAHFRGTVDMQRKGGQPQAQGQGGQRPPQQQQQQQQPANTPPQPAAAHH